MQVKPYAGKVQLSTRERILAALQGKPVDRIPFVPLIDWYTIMDFPRELVKKAEPLGYNRGLLLLSRELGIDIMLRHVLVTESYRRTTSHLEALGWYDSSIKLSSERKGNEHFESMETPVGTLSAIWGFTDKVSWIPHPTKHAVSSHEEMKIFHYAVDHLSEERVAPNYDNFLAVDDEVGDDGLATASISNTPLMYLIEMIWGLENTYYLLHDYREEVEDILGKLHQSQLRYVEEVAKSPARVVIIYENSSSTLLSPKVYRKYCLPYLNKYAEVLQSAGKIFLVHACGKLRSFVDDMAGGKFNGVADIAPPPTGDLPLDEAAAGLPGKAVVGGIDATTFVTQDGAALEAQITGLIERLKPFSGVLLGSADTTPRGTPIENFKLVQRLVNTVGSYG